MRVSADPSAFAHPPTRSPARPPALHRFPRSTGSVLAWFRRLVGGPDYKTLDAEAAAVPPGAEGLVAQEHLQGNRTPHTDPLSRGALVGLTLRHGRGHIFRALMEGVAFGTRLIIETMRCAPSCWGNRRRRLVWRSLCRGKSA